MIDTHVHLQFEAYENDLDTVLRRAVEAGVRACVIPGSNLESSRAAVALVERFPVYDAGHAACKLYAAVGVHPTSSNELTPAILDELRVLARHSKVVAIGEIGLDYYWPNVPNRKWPCPEPAHQREAFRSLLALASAVKLPVIVHDRDAHEDALSILGTWVEQSPEAAKGTLHAYAGGPALLKQALGLGFYIGMDGPVTFKKARALHQVAQQVSLARLLLETDGPYLTPHPYRGKRNEPAYLVHIARRIADLRSVSFDEIVSNTQQNAQRLFGIEV